MGARRIEPRPFTADVEMELSQHAQRRIEARGISLVAVAAAVEYGRLVHVRGAVIFALGRREVATARVHGLDLSRYCGTQVVTAGSLVLTVYKNESFKGLRHEGFKRARPRPALDARSAWVGN